MTRTVSKTWRIAVIGVATAMVAGGALGALPASAASQPASAPKQHRSHHQGQLPVRPGSDYLALGDSVPFGYREAANPPPPVYTDPANFIGYPEDIGAELGVNTINAACPGETTASFINASAPSNGCETAAGGAGPGYRAFPLHVAYRGAQLRFAVHYLQRHRHTRLVSLMIGANDGFLCQETTADNCVSELPSVLAKVGTNIATILGRIRNTAHYRGQIVIVNYYSLDYSSALDNAQSQTLNQAIDSAARPFHVRIADGFATFRAAAAQAGGNSCTAGLLTTLTTGGCGVHPSVAGQELLAGAVERVVRKA